MRRTGFRWLIAFSLAFMLISEACTAPHTPLPPITPQTTPSPTQILPSSTPQTRLAPLASSNPELSFTSQGHTDYGEWTAKVTVSQTNWKPGLPLNLNTTLHITTDHLLGLYGAGFKADGFCLLVTAERTFDPDGWLRLPSDERMSTLITPTGLAIEGGVQGAVTNRFGTYDFRTPVDEFRTIPLSAVTNSNGEYQAAFNLQTRLPDDLPPGIYRLRLDFGITVGRRYLSLNGDAFAYRPFPKGQPVDSDLYSPPIPASAPAVSGQIIQASTIKPRVPWIILGNYNSNGYNGVVADEDQSHFALSPRTLIPDSVILPLYASDNKSRLTYSLEPQFPADTIDERSNIPWDYTRGELSVQVTGPDGNTADLGTAPFVGKTGRWPTTKKPAFTAWRPSAYGQYSARMTGWIADIWGNRYEGGGTYHFWIAKRMTLATATFQGQPYPVGSRYGRDLGFAPAVPADVQVDATLYVNSDPQNKKTISYRGKASPGGIFGAAQGAQPLVLDSPGEYVARILAKYTDQDGHLWICSMHHAGIVYSEDSPIVARGKKLNVAGKLVNQGDTNFEGYVEAPDINHLAHINYPFLAGDVLLIASDHQGANKIEPVLTYELKDKPAPYDPRLQNIGATNLKIKTSNGYSPHLFPEYITDMAYYYAGAPRPGFMSRFLVAENGTRAPYWPTSPNSFGGQINASSNGDLPGDIYRLIGGIAIKNRGVMPVYAGYMASAFILPKDSKNNRIITAGSQDLLGPDKTLARLFLVGTRPGMVYETGTTFAPAVQIDPILPAAITFTLTYPDGRKVTAQGTGDKFGTFAGKDKWTLDMPGTYHFTLAAEWQGYQGHMPGLPSTGGDFYVIEKERPEGTAGLSLRLPEQSSFSPIGNLIITGFSSASKVDFAAVIPGAVITQGSLPVNNGMFTYIFDPAQINRLFPTYDIVNLVNGKPEIKDVVQLTFFSTERTLAGESYHAFARVLMRGTSVIYAH